MDDLSNRREGRDSSTFGSRFGHYSALHNEFENACEVVPARPENFIVSAGQNVNHGFLREKLDPAHFGMKKTSRSLK